MEKPPLSFFAMSFILLFAVISFIFIIFELHRFAFVFELMVFLILVIVLSFGMFMAYHNKKWGWTLVGASLVMTMLNVFFAYALTSDFGTGHLTTLLFSIAGIVLSLFNLRDDFKPKYEAGEDIKIKEYYPFIDKIEPEIETMQPKGKADEAE